MGVKQRDKIDFLKESVSLLQYKLNMYIFAMDKNNKYLKKIVENSRLRSELLERLFSQGAQGPRMGKLSTLDYSGAISNIKPFGPNSQIKVLKTKTTRRHNGV